MLELTAQGFLLVVAWSAKAVVYLVAFYVVYFSALFLAVVLGDYAASFVDRFKPGVQETYRDFLWEVFWELMEA